VPGDEIIGFITRGRGVSIHRKDCSNFKHLAEAEPDRVIDASWTGEHNAKFLAEISIEANDRHGLIADISTTLTNSKLSVKAINARTTRNHLALINLTIEVTSVEQIEKLIRDLRKLNGIIDVYRNLS
ncbi:MAG: ACT domain-containing protein, partial [Caloramator sp.]|nr:ACT domain-containing protein [Caloramator sp.]